MQLRSILKPESSITVALATAGTVYAVYNVQLGSVAGAAASDPNHPALAASRKKAGYVAFALVSGLFLLTRDGNVATIGYASIIGMEVTYRHAIMAHPETGQIVAPPADAYTPAQNVIPLTLQGQTG